MVPSSFGMTFCVDGEQEEILLDVSWGRYERTEDQEITISDKRKDSSKENKIKKLKVWERLPCGGKLKIPLVSGPIKPLNVDSTNLGVIVQGNIREKNETGSRLVTVFLVNAQTEPFENKDTSWIFQPSIKVKSVREGLAIFRRRIFSRSQIEDMELQGLDMIYRKNVEFCVGHGVSVHASLKEGTSTEAFCVETEVMPEYEVPITETPGREPEDRSVLREINDKGFLDMLELSKMGRDDLIEKLKLLTEDYKNWIEEQKDRIGKDVTGFDDVSKFTIERCESIHERLEEGVKTLENPKDDKAFEAFRMANLVMANQRVRSIFALKRGVVKKWVFPIWISRRTGHGDHFSWLSSYFRFHL